MKKLSLVFVLFFVVSINPIFSQGITPDFATTTPEYKIKEFEILIPENQIQNSLYDSIDFNDARIDQTNLGFVQLGAFNRQAEVIPKFPFASQLKKAMQAFTDSSAKSGALLFQLRQFKFAEVTGPMSETGYWNFKAEIYSKKDGHYQKLAKIDTILVVRSMDVTKPLLKNGSKIMTDFIANNLLKEAADSRIYSFREVIKMDSTEKRAIALYNTDTYTEGLYYNYESFSSQKPDKHAFVETKKDGRISRVKINGANDELVKLKPRDIYAIVYNGQPYMATQFGYYPVTKTKDDFYFTGKIKVSGSSADIFVAQMMFGIVGGMLAANANALYEMKLDYSNGNYIRIKQIPYPQN